MSEFDPLPCSGMGIRTGLRTNLRQRYSRRMTDSSFGAKAKTGLCPLLESDEWSDLERQLATWLGAHSEVPPEECRRQLDATVLIMLDRACNWCRERDRVIHLSMNAYRARSAADDREHTLLRDGSWENDLIDQAIRFTAPHEISNGTVNPARFLSRIRSSEQKKWRSEIENAIWFAVGQAMQKYLRNSKPNVLPLENAEGRFVADDPRAVATRDIAASLAVEKEVTPSLFTAVVQLCDHNHAHCFAVLSEASDLTRPNSERRAVLLLADEYRSGSFDRRICHKHYRSLPITRSGTTLGQLLDVLDEMMGLARGLSPDSPLRSAPPQPLAQQSSLGDACRKLNIQFGDDVAGALRKLRDEFRVHLGKILKARIDRRRSLRDDEDISRESASC